MLFWWLGLSVCLGIKLLLEFCYYMSVGWGFGYWIGVFWLFDLGYCVSDRVDF